MIIGVPREIKQDEHRVGMTPAGVRDAVAAGIQVLVQNGAGSKIGFLDDHYRRAGATTIERAADLYAQADMIVKVKEPQPDECARLRKGQILFTYLHLAPDGRQTEALERSGVTAFAYETITDARGGLPLLAPMSEIAGRMAVQVGARCLEIEHGGSGLLLGGVPGVLPAKVVVIGGGVVGSNAARTAVGMGADVTVVDRSLGRLAQLDELFGPALKTAFATAETTDNLVTDADLVIGAVLLPGAAAPKLVLRTTIEKMRPGSAVVDVAIDQGGCFETSRATTHSHPTYVAAGVVHYCVANMPGAVARTSTLALTQATLPLIVKLASLGWRQAIVADPHLANGLNVHEGHILCEPVARAQHKPYLSVQELLAG